ncbi:sigma-70 family RNA polymerase sigma factor [Egibacter rhizosphaerae]|uniref:Sigma-70 family RNA polymerase sigma factor n=1 Tax=Egibacter rhizosphaerae TaxID=1670831 RepID=A0A411YEC0_9ACTN|nr:RNA polymerase sigma factor SigJ [Egibacter rhizosphaerae]QBI19604.1 sigma-70 family RNA polymerase sigma factor [Egibacter rhizosphaerae]
MSQPATPDPSDEVAAAFERLRPRLIGVAYGLLGTLGEAEDAVQEAWLRLQRSDVETIDDLTGWLVSTTSRIAIDVLRSARVRREAYVGPWLPEPIETVDDPADSVGLADTLSWAMMVVLETLGPAERAAFVLHDVFGLPFTEVGVVLGRTPASCRKLASRAREHVRARQPRFDVDPESHREVVEAFAATAMSGDVDGLLDVLAPDAVLTADGGGVVPAALEPIPGAHVVARFLAATLGSTEFASSRITVINGLPALLTVDVAMVRTVITLGIRNGRIVTIDAVRNPYKLRRLRSSGAVAS